VSSFVSARGVVPGGIRPALTVLAVAGGVLGVLGTVSGCATKGVPYQTPSTQSAAPTGAVTAPTASSGPLPTASMTPLPAAAGQLTGTELESVLLPASDFPAGFAVSSSGPVTSGGSLEVAAAQYNLATVSCADFVSHLGSTGFGETAMAFDSVVGTDQAYDQVVYQFGSAAGASAFVAGVKSLAARCSASFSADDNGTNGTYRLTASPGADVAGYPTLDLVQSGTESGTSVILDTLFSASGVDVFAAAGVGLGAGAPAVPAKETIIYNLMKRQAAEAVLS
jgi:hypothetical protein